MPHLKATNPCVDCITFAICINMFTTLYPVNSLLFFDTISGKCSILYDYLYSKGYIDGSRMVKTYDYYYEHSNLTKEQVNGDAL